MRNTSLLILLHLAFCPSIYAQEIEGLSYRISLLTDSIMLSLDTTGYGQLPLGKENFDLAGCHVVDLNLDGKNDLIYTLGFPPYLNVQMYLNNGKRLEEVYTYIGALQAIKQTSQTSVVYFVKNSCCCDAYSDLVKVEVDKASKVTEDIISFHYETEISESPKFLHKQLSGTLRTIPSVNDSLMRDPCTDDTLIGNRIGELARQSVWVLTSEGDWHLIIPQQTDSVHRLIAWIKEK